MTLKRERDVTFLMERYLNVAKDALKAASGSIEFFLQEDPRSAKSLLIKQKSFCAEIVNYRKMIWEKLGKGAFLPLIRVDLWATVHHIAGITDAAKVCCETFLLQQPRLPRSVVPKVALMSTTVFRLFPPVSDSVLHYLKGPDIMAAISGNMDILDRGRRELDDIESGIGHELLSCSLAPGDKAVADICIRSLSDVASRICRAFDQVQLITIKL